MVSASPEITDIRSSTVIDMRKAIISGLKETPPTLPTVILYDEQGLKLFEKITYLDEYYLTNCEIAILSSKSDEIVKCLGLKDGGIVVELGSGYLDLRGKPFTKQESSQNSSSSRCPGKVANRYNLLRSRSRSAGTRSVIAGSHFHVHIRQSRWAPRNV